MGRKDLIPCEAFFEYPDGRVVPFDSLSYEEKIEINKEWIRRWEKLLPELYRGNLEALKSIPEATPEEIEEYYKLFPEKRKNRPKLSGT